MNISMKNLKPGYQEKVVIYHSWNLMGVENYFAMCMIKDQNLKKI